MIFLNKTLKYLLLIGFSALGSINMLYAQCPMCKASIEASSGGQSALAEGLNNGILYMLALPYLMIMVVGFLWYRKSKKKEIAAAALDS